MLDFWGWPGALILIIKYQILVVVAPFWHLLIFTYTYICIRFVCSYVHTHAYVQPIHIIWNACICTTVFVYTAYMCVCVYVCMFGVNAVASLLFYSIICSPWLPMAILAVMCLCILFNFSWHHQSEIVLFSLLCFWEVFYLTFKHVYVHANVLCAYIRMFMYVYVYVETQMCLCICTNTKCTCVHT